MLMPLVAGEPSIAEVLEQTTPRYRAVITDDQGLPIPAASLTELLLTLTVIRSNGTITFLRADQPAINANNVTVDANGVLVWSIQVADTTLVEDLPAERHIALFEWGWGTGRKGKHELVLVVKNLTAVP